MSAKTLLDEKKGEYDIAVKKFQECEKAFLEKKKPLDAVKKELDNAKNSINQNSSVARRMAEKFSKEIRDKEYNLLQNHQQKEEELKQVDREDKKHREEIAKKEQEIVETNEKIQKAGPPPKDIDDKLRSKQAELDRIVLQCTDVESNRKQMAENIKQKNAKADNKQKQIDAFKDARQLRLDMLLKNSYTAPLWHVHQYLGTPMFAHVHVHVHVCVCVHVCVRVC
jgi:chromosome segregation ATPase